MTHDVRLPLYYQLLEMLVKKIEDNSWPEHHQLPSERELCDHYQMSRTTVRKTMQLLEQNGYIVTKHGKGSFVAPKVYDQSLVNFYSFTNEMKNLGKTPSSQVLGFEKVACNTEIASKLHLEKGEEVYMITRLRLADLEPMMYETSYLPTKRFPNFTKERLEDLPMYEIFSKDYRVQITKAHERFHAVLIEKEVMDILHVPESIPSLRIERSTYENHTVVEYTVSYARGDKFSYSIELNPTNKS
ncbi:GntR family transcriptional regulator [Neobacillus niacini]|uniref:GntR family transcriptional regulator n=1 Tax=Neobacillus niacini TaxID=86668 RepID=UPI002865A5D5|nr:GntR family transcriptional regulator [Neobacillus niacini]MDR7079480.1 GntR family transcriptional regulator [Neobacillus niacini]